MLRSFAAARLQTLHGSVDELGDLRERIDKTIVPEPPISLSDGGVIEGGVDKELDELRDLSRNSKQFLAQIEQRERQRTGINSLKVKFNSIFGYYLEVSKPNLHLVPADYDRKQTLVNAERFTTPELKGTKQRFSMPRKRSSRSSGGCLRKCVRPLREKRGASARPRSRWRKWTCWRPGEYRGSAKLLPPAIR